MSHSKPPSNAHEIHLVEAVPQLVTKPDAATLWLLDNRPGLQGESSRALMRYHLTGRLPGLSEYPYDIADFWRCWNLCNRVPGVKKSLEKLGLDVQASGWYGWVADYDVHEAYILQHPELFPTP